MFRSRLWAGLGLIVLAALLAAAGWGYRQASAYASVGGAYLAKQDCSCLFVAGRSEASCHAEFEPDISKFKIIVDRSHLPARASVTAQVLMFRGQASYTDGYGCTVSK
jgi:hypothetical protein